MKPALKKVKEIVIYLDWDKITKGIEKDLNRDLRGKPSRLPDKLKYLRGLG
ncbi:MAG: hypothetical protein NTV42_05210 [Chloroflexi bacterium]|nr:hypothetical protein [Chloroflexota bacterium]